MSKQSVFIFQVFVALGFIMAVVGYTAAISQAFVSRDTILKVIQKGDSRAQASESPHKLNKIEREQFEYDLKECSKAKDIDYCMLGNAWH